MRFMLIGRDGKDPGAPARRQAARPKHLEGAEKLKKDGKLVHAAALLDDSGAMDGSVLMLEFPDRAALDAWLKDEPYTVGGVWKDVEVRVVKPAPGF